MNIFKILLFTILLTGIISLKKDTHVADCLKQNVFQNPSNSTKTIESMDVCHKISKSCCYINLSYAYNYIDIVAQYCIDLTVNISAMQIFLSNLYNDDLIYFTNATAHMFDDYVKFGRNYASRLVYNLSCYASPNSSRYYSDYALTNCAVFDDEGSCIVLNDNTYFKNFLVAYHSYFSGNYCSKKSKDKKCIYPYGKRGNPLMARPLLTELVSYLKADTDEEAVTDDDGNIQFDAEEEEDSATSSKYISSWTYPNGDNVPCKAFHNITFKIECPSGYNYDFYLKFSFIKVFLLFIFVFL
jgi:hypothetical protein